VQQHDGARTSQGSVSAALAAVRAEASSKFPGSVSSASAPSGRSPGEAGGLSLIDMAQRDLDVALQLLADRAQYITGASGVAIALRRDGRNDMLCRASTGSNAPEMGALLSTEFGLSGESVRTRQPLRCDDAEHDARVNREVCRQLGIASVVVMPVANDDEVLGVFELFSGKANAFGERDVSAVHRLSQMVETAVRLAQAAEDLPERLSAPETSTPQAANAELTEDQVLDRQLLGEDVQAQKDPGNHVSADHWEDQVLEEQEPASEVGAGTFSEKMGPAASEALSDKEDAIAALEALCGPKKDSTTPEAAASDTQHPIVESKSAAPEPVLNQAQGLKVKPEPEPAVEIPATKKPLFWSAALKLAGDEERSEEPDQSHVPPVLRNLRKCEACGFPISAGRVLCVECEEKRWKGQLRVPRESTPRQIEMPAIVPEKPKPHIPPISLPQNAPAAEPKSAEESKEVATGALAVASGESLASHPKVSVPSEPARISSPAFVLSAGLEPSQSWLSANKYIIGALLLVAIVVIGFFLLR